MPQTAGLMGVYKDAFFLEVWKFLLLRRDCKAYLSTLNAPTFGPHGSSPAVRQAWASLQANFAAEGLKKAHGMKVVLQSRPDMFFLANGDAGHPFVSLTPAAQMLNPEDGLDAHRLSAAATTAALTASAEPSLLSAGLGDSGLGFSASGTGSGTDGSAAETLTGTITGGNGEAIELSNAGILPVGVITGDRGILPVGLISGGAKRSLDDLQDFVVTAPVSKKQKTTTKSKGKSDWATPGVPLWTHRGFMDLIWTPTIAAVRERLRRSEGAFIRALYEAVDQFDGEGVPVSQIGMDFKVAKLKKDPQFVHEKVIDILMRYEHVFDVTMDPEKGGYKVNLQPGAAAALPDVDEFLNVLPTDADLQLPDRIPNPRGAKEKMQALRIEIVHALHRRGGRANPQDLGQEHRVQKRKEGISQAKKMSDFIKLFPGNFMVGVDEHNQQIVEIKSYDVYDTSMIEYSVSKQQQMYDTRTGPYRYVPGGPRHQSGQSSSHASSRRDASSRSSHSRGPDYHDIAYQQYAAQVAAHHQYAMAASAAASYAAAGYGNGAPGHGLPQGFSAPAAPAPPRAPGAPAAPLAIGYGSSFAAPIPGVPPPPCGAGHQV